MLDQGLIGRGEEGNKEKDPVFIAEKKFFEVLKAQKDARLKQDKPLVFNDDEWFNMVLSNTRTFSLHSSGLHCGQEYLVVSDLHLLLLSTILWPRTKCFSKVCCKSGLFVPPSLRNLFHKAAGWMLRLSQQQFLLFMVAHSCQLRE